VRIKLTTSFTSKSAFENKNKGCPSCRSFWSLPNDATNLIIKHAHSPLRCFVNSQMYFHNTMSLKQQPRKNAARQQLPASMRSLLTLKACGMIFANDILSDS
jgi:hypothetical protein